MIFLSIVYIGEKMQDFDIIEKAGVSYDSYCEAVKNALKSAHKKVFWFEVVEQRGRMTEDDKIEFQVVVRIGCK
jgi:flavin-binding protein dodecin